MVTLSKCRMYAGVLGVAAVVGAFWLLAGGSFAASSAAPVNTSEPTISGTPRVGSTLTANPGTWTGTQPIHFSYRWVRCSPNGGNCVAIAGATAQTYRLTVADRGNTIRVVVSASNVDGRGVARSDPTAVIQPAAGPPPPPPPPPPAPGTCAAISSISLPDRLVIDQIKYNPTKVRSRDEPLVARFHVTSGRGCVRGAIVYAVGVPFDRLSKEPEVATGADGWAQITFHILPTFELRSGNLVVIFVRARKGGEDILGGVSNRRLVSVRVA